MRILITTQVVDSKDPFTSFFTGWLTAFAPRFERIEVVCLKEGDHELPANVHVHSLGKEHESGAAFFKRIRYAMRLYRYAWSLRNEYDAVLVHMNQEYVLLCGPLWRILGKRVYLWRNHYSGSALTDFAALWCTKVFCTSRFSYTAKYKKTVFMPVGVDTALFRPDPKVERSPASVLFFGRFAPSKRPRVLVEALGILKSRDCTFAASFYGDALPQYAEYRTEVMARARELGLDARIHFHAGVANAKAPKVFEAHELYVNLGESGMYDKTIFEAAACGCIVLAASRDFAGEVGEEFSFEADDAHMLAGRIEQMLVLEGARRSLALRTLEDFVGRNSLTMLAEKLERELA